MGPRPKVLEAAAGAEAAPLVARKEGAGSALSASVLFHLNLCYSAIEVEERPAVVRRAYAPLLALADELPWLTLALEAPLFTLEEIARIDPDWLARLRELVAAGRVELVGSGDTQLAGPLVPAAVNRWNQELGARGYEALFGLRPRTALVAEMCFSQGLVDAYLDAGYETLIVEWNNAHRAHPEWEGDWRYESAWTPSPSGRRIRVAWVDTILFQRFQRVVSGELDPAEYRSWVLARRGGSPRHLFLYAGDAEVLGYRPGRYATEPALVRDEWAGVARVLHELREEGLAFTAPSAFAGAAEPTRTLSLSSAADPVPVKKQPKYNVTRWALSGRDDLRLNSACFARARELEERAASPEEWRALCRDWASDHRTHLTARRWEALRLPAEPRALPGATERPTSARRFAARVRGDERRLVVETDGVQLVLNTRRGLAVEALAFPPVSPRPLVGTLPQGSFDDIDWAADFYTGHALLEVPAQRRLADLEPVRPRVERRADHVAIAADVPTPLGPLPKLVRVGERSVEVGWGFSHLGPRPAGSLRAGHVTLLEDGLGPELFVTCASGGRPERMPVTGSFDHGQAVSALVSARTAFGATDGRIALDDGRTALELSWRPELCAALPLLTHRWVAGRRFARIALSLGEIDETLVPGAPFPDLRFTLRARRVAGAPIP